MTEAQENLLSDDQEAFLDAAEAKGISTRDVVFHHELTQNQVFVQPTHFSDIPEPGARIVDEPIFGVDAYLVEPEDIIRSHPDKATDEYEPADVLQEQLLLDVDAATDEILAVYDKATTAASQLDRNQRDATFREFEGLAMAFLKATMQELRLVDIGMLEINFGTDTEASRFQAQQLARKARVFGRAIQKLKEPLVSRWAAPIDPPIYIENVQRKGTKLEVVGEPIVMDHVGELFHGALTTIQGSITELTGGE